jgi:hypothetical protein
MQPQRHGRGNHAVSRGRRHARGPGRRAKKVNGRKRHIAAGTTGLVLDVVITATFARREGRPPGA